MKREESSGQEIVRGPWIHGSLYDEEQQRQARVRLEIAKLKHEIEQQKQAEVRKQLNQERCRVFGRDRANQLKSRTEPFHGFWVNRNCGRCWNILIFRRAF